MEHDVNLNIHYSAPDEIWNKIVQVYQLMPFWAEDDSSPRWIGPDIDIWASIEPGGIQIAGSMPEDIWQGWYDSLKKRLTEVLGYEIGEPEDGYEFHYYD